jgi:hypothetical protein
MRHEACRTRVHNGVSFVLALGSLVAQHTFAVQQGGLEDEVKTIIYQQVLVSAL